MADLRLVVGRLNLTIESGNTEAAELTWPAGSLDGLGPWTATVTPATGNPISMPVTVDGDVMTIDVTGTTSLLHQPAAPWRLLDTSTGNKRIGGSFLVTDQPGEAVIAATVVIDEGTVTVNVLSDAPVSSVNGQTGAVTLDAADVGADPAGSADAVQANLETHEARLTSDVHGVHRFDWAVTGVGVLTENVINQDGAQAFTATVVDDRLVVTAASAEGNQRVAYELAGTDGLVDSEMRSLFWSPVGFPSAQQGHIHRVREISPGLWEGIAVWTAVFGGDYAIINTRGVRWTGGDPTGPPPASLGQSNGDNPVSIGNFIDRLLRVRAYSRFEFPELTWLNRYYIDGPFERLRTLTAGDLVTIDEMADTTFNQTSVALAGIDITAGNITIGDPEDTNAVVITQTMEGRIIPVSSTQKRWTPYWLASRVRGGNTTAAVVELKAWRVEEPEPDWGGPRTLRRNISAPSATVPELAVGPGSCALWTAHLISTSQVSWGQVEVRSLD